MNFRAFMIGVGSVFGWIGSNILWPSTRAIVLFFWEGLVAITRPGTKKIGDWIAFALPFLVLGGVIAGGLWALLHVDERTQDLVIGVGMLFGIGVIMAVVLSSFVKKSPPPPPRNNRRSRR